MLSSCARVGIFRGSVCLWFEVDIPDPSPCVDFRMGLLFCVRAGEVPVYLSP